MKSKENLNYDSYKDRKSNLTFIIFLVSSLIFLTYVSFSLHYRQRIKTLNQTLQQLTNRLDSLNSEVKLLSKKFITSSTNVSDNIIKNEVPILPGITSYDVNAAIVYPDKNKPFFYTETRINYYDDTLKLFWGATTDTFYNGKNPLVEIYYDKKAIDTIDIPFKIVNSKIVLNASLSDFNGTNFLDIRNDTLFLTGPDTWQHITIIGTEYNKVIKDPYGNIALCVRNGLENTIQVQGYLWGRRKAAMMVMGYGGQYLLLRNRVKAKFYEAYEKCEVTDPFIYDGKRIIAQVKGLKPNAKGF